MSKEKKLILIGGRTYPIESVNLNELSLSQFHQLLAEERREATKHCITLLRPYVKGITGRTRLNAIEVEVGEYLVEGEEVVQEPSEFVLFDTQQNQVIETFDFSNIRQVLTISG